MSAHRFWSFAHLILRRPTRRKAPPGVDVREICSARARARTPGSCECNPARALRPILVRLALLACVELPRETIASE
jgi:hypothetical protein